MADSSSSLTPEKRLLNLIENGGKSGAASTGQDSLGTAMPGRPAFSGPSFEERMKNAPDQIRNYFVNFRDRFGLKTINKTARILLGVLSLLTLGNALYEMKMAGRDPLLGLDIADRKISRIDVDEPAFDASKIQSSESRNVFLPFAKREELAVSKTQNSGSGKLLDMTKTLKLAGISFNPEDPKATYCMIEDLQKSITVFLREGDYVSGMMVGKILEESVTLQYENDKIEIR